MLPFSPVTGASREFSSPRKKKAQISFAQSSFSLSIMEDESSNDQKKVHTDMQFLYDQLRKITHERNLLMEKVEILSSQLHDLQVNFKDVILRREVDEESFRRAIRHDKTTNDRRFVKQTLKTQDRDNLLLDWVNAVISNRLDERHKYLAVLTQRTGVVLPKARNLAQYITEQQGRKQNRFFEDSTTGHDHDHYDVSNADNIAHASGQKKKGRQSPLDGSVSVLDHFGDLEAGLSPQLVQGYANYITVDGDKGMGGMGGGHDSAGEDTDTELVVLGGREAVVALHNAHRDSPVSNNIRQKGNSSAAAAAMSKTPTKTKRKKKAPASVGKERAVSPRGKSAAGQNAATSVTKSTPRRKSKNRSRGNTHSSSNGRSSDRDDNEDDEEDEGEEVNNGGDDCEDDGDDDDGHRTLRDTVARSIIDYNALINNDMDSGGEDSLGRLDHVLYNHGSAVNRDVQHAASSAEARSLSPLSLSSEGRPLRAEHQQPTVTDFSLYSESRHKSAGGVHAKNTRSSDSNKHNSYSRFNQGSIEEGDDGDEQPTPEVTVRKRITTGTAGTRDSGDASRTGTADAVITSNAHGGGGGLSGRDGRRSQRGDEDDDERTSESELLHNHSTRGNILNETSNSNKHGNTIGDEVYNYDGIVSNILNTVSEINRSLAEDDIRDGVRSAARESRSPAGRVPSASASIVKDGGSANNSQSYSYAFDSTTSKGGLSPAKVTEVSPVPLSATSKAAAAVDLMSGSELYNLSESLSTMQQDANRVAAEIKSASSDKYWWDVSLDAKKEGSQHQQPPSQTQPNQSSRSNASSQKKKSRGGGGGGQDNKDTLKLGGDFDCDASM